MGVPEGLSAALASRISNPVTQDIATQGLNKPATNLVVPDNGRAFVAPQRHVIQTPFIVNSQLPRHAVIQFSHRSQNNI